jgi:hypothetical protein
MHRREEPIPRLLDVEVGNGELVEDDDLELWAWDPLLRFQNSLHDDDVFVVLAVGCA